MAVTTVALGGGGDHESGVRRRRVPPAIVLAFVEIFGVEISVDDAGGWFAAAVAAEVTVDGEDIGFAFGGLLEGNEWRPAGRG